MSEFASRAKATWARLIRKVYEANPLVCPKCNGPMRVIALIADPTVVRRILEHLGRWAPGPAERGTPEEAPDWPRNAVIPITYHPVADIAHYPSQVVPSTADSAGDRFNRPDAQKARD